MMSAPLRSLPSFAVLALLPAIATAQTYDLTGLWKSNTAAEVYRVRQIDNHFYWMVDGTPQRGYANVFEGFISGNTISGQWVNMPGSPALDRRTATLTFKIESNDRFVKQTETGYTYNGTVWTRVSSSSQPPIANPSGTAPPSSSNTTLTVIEGGTKGWDYRNVGGDYKIGDKVRITCPAAEHKGWRYLAGTNVYSGDSVVCQAAVFQGIMSWSGGTIVFEVLPGQSLYLDGEQNGVQSTRSYQKGASFRFIT